MKNIFLFLLILMSVGSYAQSPINLKKQTNISDYIGNELEGRLVDTLSTLSDTTAAVNAIGRIVHVVSEDTKWTVNSSGSWEVLSVSGLSDNIGEYFFTFDEAKTIDDDSLANEFPNITYNPNNGRLTMVYRKATDHEYASGGKSVFRYSDDNGATWSAAADLLNLGAPFDSGVEQTIMWDDSTDQYIATGLVRLTSDYDSISTFIMIQTSGDGITWSSPDTLDQPVDQGVFDIPNNFIRNGDKLINTGWYRSLDTARLYYMESLDDGVTWSYTIVDEGDTTDGSNEGQIVLYQDTIFIFARQYAGNGAALSRFHSTDDGATWSSEIDVTPEGYDFGSKPNVEVIDDVFVTVYRNQTLSGDLSPAVSLSYDNGLTWTKFDYVPYTVGLGQLDYSDFEKINDNTYYHVFAQDDNIKGQYYLRGVGHDFDALTKYKLYTRGKSGAWEDALVTVNPETDNYCIGLEAGSDSTASTYQIAIGRYSGQFNNAFAQTAISTAAGRNNTGDYQVAIGQQAGQNNTGNIQVAVGQYAGINNNGDFQAALGQDAGASNSGNQQVAIGQGAGRQNTGIQQVAIGAYSGYNNTGANQIAIGSQNVGYNNTGEDQIALGRSTGRFNTGERQIALGYFAGRNNTGKYQIAIGLEAGESNDGMNNIGIGEKANRYSTGDFNVAIGALAIENTGSSGSSNTAVGTGALQRVNSGSYNVAIGSSAFSQFGIGNENIAIGYLSRSLGQNHNN